MGRDKALLPWPPLGESTGQTFLSSAIRSFTSFNDMVIVVAGENESAVAPVVYANAGFLVRNPDPSRGQFSSLQVGLHEVLNRGRDAAMITLVDRPPVGGNTISLLLEAFEAAVRRGKWAVIPQFEGKHGHPFLIGRELMEAFLRAPANSNARDIERQHAAYLEYVDVSDPAITLNVDTPQDYAQLCPSAE
jgi:molybdenum cofactor cytidylyltransferase